MIFLNTIPTYFSAFAIISKENVSFHQKNLIMFFVFCWHRARTAVKSVWLVRKEKKCSFGLFNWKKASSACAQSIPVNFFTILLSCLNDSSVKKTQTKQAKGSEALQLEIEAKIPCPSGPNWLWEETHLKHKVLHKLKKNTKPPNVFF